MRKTVLACFALLLAVSPAFGAAAQKVTGKHAKEGITCEDCHKTAEPAAAASQYQCMECHGDMYDGQKVKFKDPVREYNMNPHDSHESPIDCTKCHASHKPATLYCNTEKCHSFDLKVP